MDKTTFKEIRNLLLVVGAGGGLAVAVALYLVLFHSPTGSYKAKNVLLSPAMMRGDLNFKEQNPKTGGMSRFVFDRVVITLFDEKSGRQKEVSVSADQYREIYSLLGDDRSLTELSNDFLSRFLTTVPLKMMLYVKTENSAEWERSGKLFQTVDFVFMGNDYRISLKQQSREAGFAYFHHPGIYDKVLAIMGEN